MLTLRVDRPVGGYQGLPKRYAFSRRTPRLFIAERPVSCEFRRDPALITVRYVIAEPVRAQCRRSGR
jgi:hypothetical protein